MLALLINLSVAAWNIRFVCTVYTEPVSPVGKLGLSEQGDPVFSSFPGNIAPSGVCYTSEDRGEMPNQEPALPHPYPGGLLPLRIIPSPNPTPRDEERLWHSMWTPITSPNRRNTQLVGSACFLAPLCSGAEIQISLNVFFLLIWTKIRFSIAGPGR